MERQFPTVTPWKNIHRRVCNSWYLYIYDEYMIIFNKLTLKNCSFFEEDKSL